jgi:hypothetical protein
MKSPELRMHCWVQYDSRLLDYGQIQYYVIFIHIYIYLVGGFSPSEKYESKLG